MLNKTCVACTPFFQSLEDKVELQLKGCISTDMELSYVLYSYDNQGLETEVHSSGVSISENGLFEICYTFDPISLAVYKSAVKFCAKLYTETEESRIEIKEFAFREVFEGIQREEEVKKPISNLTVNEQGEKCGNQQIEKAYPPEFTSCGTASEIGIIPEIQFYSIGKA